MIECQTDNQGEHLQDEEIDSLSWFEEVLFYRLIVTCDDFGRYGRRAKIIKGSCFPLKDITEKDIDKALGRLSAVGFGQSV